MNVVSVIPSEDWSDQVGWINITLVRNGKVIRKINFEGHPLLLNVESNGDFNEIRVEFLSGDVMLRSDFKKNYILQKVAMFAGYSKLDIHIHSVKGHHERETMYFPECNSDSDDDDDYDDEPEYAGYASIKFSDTEIEDDVEYVMIKLRNPKYNNSSDEESEVEGEPEVKKTKLEVLV